MCELCTRLGQAQVTAHKAMRTQLDISNQVTDGIPSGLSLLLFSIILPFFNFTNIYLVPQSSRVSALSPVKE